MKKLKIFMMMAALSVVLCACGGKEAEPSNDVVGDKDTVIEQMVEDVKEEKLAVEDKKNKDSKSYECLPEVLQAGPEQRLMQYEDIVFRMDMSMSLREVFSALRDSGKEFSVRNIDQEEISLEGLVPAGDILELFLYTSESAAIYVTAVNNSDSMVSIEDEAVKVGYVMPVGDANVYICKGIRLDGAGLTYDSVKELMADYADRLEERDNFGNYSLKYTYDWMTPDGEIREGQLIFNIDQSDGSCTGVSDL